MAFVLLDSTAVIHIPPEVRVCPYCGGKLVAQFSGWSQDDDGSWLADCVELECDTQPELDEDLEGGTDAWDEWVANHSVMPYVYWLPATMAVEKWINERYRFRMD